MISTLDLSIILIYLVCMFLLGGMSSFGTQDKLSSFLVNNRSTKLAFLVLSIVSTNVGAGFFLAVSSEGYQSGVSFGASMMIVSITTSLTLAYLSGKIRKLSDKNKISTVPELISSQYLSDRASFVISIIILIGYLFVTALQLVGIGSIGSVITGVDFTDLLIIAGILTVIYTSIGGLRSNLLVDSLSFVIIIITLPIIIFSILRTSKIDFSSQLPSGHFELFAFGGASFFFFKFYFKCCICFHVHGAVAKNICCRKH